MSPWFNSDERPPEPDDPLVPPPSLGEVPYDVVASHGGRPPLHQPGVHVPEDDGSGT